MCEYVINKYYILVLGRINIKVIKYNILNIFEHLLLRLQLQTRFNKCKQVGNSTDYDISRNIYTICLLLPFANNFIVKWDKLIYSDEYLCLYLFLEYLLSEVLDKHATLIQMKSIFLQDYNQSVTII